MGRHEQWRKVAKKARRKRLRREFAIRRDKLIKEEEEKKLNLPGYQQWLKEQQELEEFAEEEEKRVREEREKKWIEDEKLAQEKWKTEQEIIKKAVLKRARQEKLIREEWEREQKKMEEEKEKKWLEEENSKKKREMLIAQIDEYMKGEREDLPEELTVASETQPGKPVCPFFAKTGTCKYKNECSRNHIRPGISKTLLFPGFYSHFSLDGAKHTEYDTDVSLEYEYSETYKHFVEFYNDIKYELDKYGKLTQLKVCLNTASHLRGNVYVSYSTEREALTVYRRFNGRYYAGRPISVEFIDIPIWKSAICGLQYANKCPKGDSCNFLHVFKNPGRQFQNADRMIELTSKSSRDDWRWSDSPPDHNHQRSRKRRRSRERSRTRRRRRRSHSRSGTRRKRDLKRNSHSERRYERKSRDDYYNWSTSSSSSEDS
uniref:Putative u2 snrnp splicing factor small subunit n=1 Tax=Triatoma infestans TaxID=30076 RepID=A0A023F5C1_TRIIF